MLSITRADQSTMLLAAWYSAVLLSVLSNSKHSKFKWTLLFNKLPPIDQRCRFISVIKMGSIMCEHYNRNSAVTRSVITRLQCNNTHEEAPHTDKQICACASDLGDASLVHYLLV